MQVAQLSWSELLPNIGIKDVNVELDKRTSVIYNGLRQLASVCSRDNNLVARIVAQKDVLFPARDQYLRSVLHIAAADVNTRLIKCLVQAGAPLNLRDGIGQTALTISLHLNNNAASVFLIESGACVQEEYYENTVSPLSIANVNKNTDIVELLEEQIGKQQRLLDHVSSFFDNRTADPLMNVDSVPNNSQKGDEISRALNINVGDQKNTVTVVGCANACPDVYGCHTPGTGDFHNRGYLNETVARIGGQGGFWHVTEKVMKRPTINPTSFKMKFKDNNYNNNEEAIYDYEDGVSIAMIKVFEKSAFFPSKAELDECLIKNGCHNEVLLSRFRMWRENSHGDALFKYQMDLVNDLIPISRFYKESIRYGNGHAIETVWMLIPDLYAQVGKINYRDESLIHLVNVTTKWPLAYRKMYQRNRTVNLEGVQGKQLAGDEWVEDHLVCPVKKYAKAQTSFSVLEMMSCSSNLLELDRNMYKSREAFDIHRTRKHCTPSSLYDQLKVAQFALKEEWFVDKERTLVPKYAWGDKVVKEGESVSARYIDAKLKGKEKLVKEFTAFLHRKFPNEMK